MRRLNLYGVLIFSFFISWGCAGPGATQPPNIYYGKDVCGECRMIIVDKKFAGGYVDPEGDIHKFDDIGCMRLFIERNKQTPLIFWVHDFGNGEWIEGEGAFFTHSQKLVTPMDYRIAAFSNDDSAKLFLKENGGHTITWDKMLEIIQKKNESIKGGE